VILRTARIMLIAAVAFTVGSHAQVTTSPETVGGAMNGQLSVAERSVMGAAEAMPEVKYDYAPSDGEFRGVRTFAEQVKHIAMVNYNFGSAILQEKPPVEIRSSNGPDSIKSKSDILKFANESFAYVRKAIATITAANMLEPIKFAGGSTTRLRIAAYAVSHPFDHYGQMVEYLRANGIVPPASQPRP
jgi:uncharacterized damage-inducible protein DinB